MFVEGDINFSFDDESKDICELGSPLNPSTPNYTNNKYNWGFEYKIVPLVHNLSLKGNDSELQKHNTMLYADDINIFDTVTGKAFIDREEHTGVVTYISYKDGGLTPKYIWILDNADKKKYALFPKSCKVKKPNQYYIQKRVNPFATNAMHLHEGYDIFADEELKYDDKAQQEAYRISYIEKYEPQLRYIDGFDDIVLYKKYEPKYIELEVFDAYSFIKLLGLDRDDKAVVLKYIKLFIKHYCHLTDREYDKAMKLQYNGGTLVWFKKWLTNQSSKLVVSSWNDIYMMTVAFMYVYNEVVHSYDYKPLYGNVKDEISFFPRRAEFKKWLNLFVCKTLSWNDTYFDSKNDKYVKLFDK